jgi:hypothetical protein
MQRVTLAHLHTPSLWVSSYPKAKVNAVGMIFVVTSTVADWTSWPLGVLTAPISSAVTRSTS